MPILKNQADVDVIGLVVSVDRKEKGPDGKNALKGLEDEFGFQTHSIVNIHEIVEELSEPSDDRLFYLNDGIKEQIAAYLNRYGA